MSSASILINLIAFETLIFQISNFIQKRVNVWLCLPSIHCKIKPTYEFKLHYLITVIYFDGFIFFVHVDSCKLYHAFMKQSFPLALLNRCNIFQLFGRKDIQHKFLFLCNKAPL
ncbi:hypothetical protein O6H91_22G005900 [Diphasiastrum complanatum]|uniref:Uncharacterized protein n=1 Tax=Diphasiastrum complanatum TaxID=34168 RepID=A0ACC2ACH2_DIPCM|nr:hypothetical protein O6H91_22G005900 [Diphasiastrum complanatum]